MWIAQEVVKITTSGASRGENSINTLRPRQNGRHFADDTFQHILSNEDVIISIKISQKFVPKGPIVNSPALVPIMAWRRPGDKPLSEPMMVGLRTRIYIYIYASLGLSELTWRNFRFSDLGLLLTSSERSLVVGWVKTVMALAYSSPFRLNTALTRISEANNSYMDTRSLYSISGRTLRGASTRYCLESRNIQKMYTSCKRFFSLNY